MTDTLITILDDAKKHVEIGARYVHYKDLNAPYTVMGIGLIESTQEPAVIYQKGFLTWIRPLTSWLETVDVEDAKIPRFQRWNS
jgi:hypothetical protein